MRNKFCALLLVAFCLAAPAQEYQRALPGYSFQFPRDYFNHEDYQTEWWYYTGNLRSSDGHRFGYELTFFREGVSRDAASNPWFVNDLWMAHMALSDIDGQRFLHEERLNRSGPGIAGVSAETGLVWNGNWQARIAEDHESLQGVGNAFGFALNLASAKPPVIEGQDGVSQKAAGMGHASHYFSLTRLTTTGTIDVGGKTYRVEGDSWMDHEFFTGSMAASETGWDWLSLQFKDGTELMLYRLRHSDGAIDPYSSGTYVDAKGKSVFLSSKDFSMTPGNAQWTSSQTHASYPIEWHVSIPRLKLQLHVTTPLPSQELTSRFGPSYWEGAIDVKGERDHASTEGSGYLEMTGYEHSDHPLLPR